MAGTDPRAWQRALSQIIDIALRHRRMLVVLERNEDVFHALSANDLEVGARMAAQNTKLSALFADTALDPRVRVRLLSGHYRDLPAEQLREQLMDVIHAPFRRFVTRLFLAEDEFTTAEIPGAIAPRRGAWPR